MSALEAMELSENEDRVVHLTYSPGLAANLFADCTGEASDVDAEELHYWGKGKRKHWRVHLHGWNGQELPSRTARQGGA